MLGIFEKWIMPTHLERCFIFQNTPPPPPSPKKNAGKNMLGKCTLEFNYKKYSVHVFMRRKKNFKKSSVEKMEGGESMWAFFFFAKGRVV
jgi:hypothetical protein